MVYSYDGVQRQDVGLDRHVKSRHRFSSDGKITANGGLARKMYYQIACRNLQSTEREDGGADCELDKNCFHPRRPAEYRGQVKIASLRTPIAEDITDWHSQNASCNSLPSSPTTIHK